MKRSTHALRKPHKFVDGADVLVQMSAAGVRVFGVIHADETNILRQSRRVAVENLPVCGLCDIGDGIGRAPL